ncbi:RNA-directed DNA polymerase from mobile element jockey [Eumeta japonica]|uniref:RNA-directed DNA polymerase from mobile element jockey n=1 Tax=Eumeta variegata TaxID=151549 RepID=A0A4C1V1Y0_EUMVA|nr:RNA-directed DNA polymerase from mobile element jockey [Eumeta japonica]
MEEIRPSHKAFWSVTKALKTEGIHLFPAQKTRRFYCPRRRGGSGVPCRLYRDSMPHVSPPHDPAHISRSRKRFKNSLEPKDDLTPVSLSEVQLLVRSLKTRKAPGLDGFGFRPALLSATSPPRSRVYFEGFKINKTVAVFFDVAKAFDRVWHAGLVHKLYSLQVPDRLVIIIQNYLTNRHFTFRHERTHSTRRLIRAGVPQGSASPLLYSAYTNDIPRPTSGVQLALSQTTPRFITRVGIEPPPYIRRLQRAIDELDQWFRLWRIDVNPDKSAAIQFKYSKGSNFVVDWNTPNLKMLNARIPWQRSYKYLGVTLDRNLLFREHIARVRDCAFLHGKARSSVSYGCTLCVRNSILHRDLELPTLSKYMKDASKRFFDIAGSHPNALLRAAVDYQPPPPTHYIRRPRNVLLDPPDALTAAVDSLNDVNDTHD